MDGRRSKRNKEYGQEAERRKKHADYSDHAQRFECSVLDAQSDKIAM